MSDERAAGDGEAGTVREVVYVGMVTRYVVDLDARRRARRRPAEPRDVLAGGALGAGQAGPPLVAAGAHVRDREGGHVRRIPKRSRVTLAAVGARRGARRSRRAAAAGGGGSTSGGGAADDDRQGRGRAQRDRVAGLHGPELREAVREADGLHHPPQGRGLLERDGRADARERRRRRRPVRPRLRLGRREPAAHLRGTTSSRSTST